MAPPTPSQRGQVGLGCAEDALGRRLMQANTQASGQEEVMAAWHDMVAVEMERSQWTQDTNGLNAGEGKNPRSTLSDGPVCVGPLG